MKSRDRSKRPSRPIRLIVKKKGLHQRQKDETDSHRNLAARLINHNTTQHSAGKEASQYEELTI